MHSIPCAKSIRKSINFSLKQSFSAFNRMANRIANAIHQSGRFTIEAPKLFHGKKTEVKQKQINKAIVIKTDQDKTSIKVQMQVGSIQILIEEYK